MSVISRCGTQNLGSSFRVVNFRNFLALVPADCACLAAMEVARIRRQFVVSFV